MYSHQDNFTKAHEWTKALKSRYLHTLALFRIYERFRKLAATNVVGKRKAETNVKLFGNYVYFFSPIQEAARCYFFIELAKFFEENKREQSLTIEIILRFIENNLSSFSKDEFLKHHAGRKIIPEILEGYKSFTLQDIKKIRRRLRKNSKPIKDLKIYRDQQLVHDDFKKDEVKITGLHIRTLLKIVQNTVDLFCLRLDFSSNIYSNYDEEPVYAVDRVVNALIEHEQKRLQAIKEKYGV